MEPRRAGPAVHNLYVLVVGAGAATPRDKKSRDLTRAILQYVHDRLPVFAKMGVRIRVHKVKKSDLSNQRLVEAMKRRSITSLPALVTPNSTYVGNRAIGEVYEKNIAEYQAYARRGAGAPAGIAPDDDELSSYYRSEMTFQKAAEDDGLGGDGDGIGEGGDMMDAYRSMMQRREKAQSRASEGVPPGGASSASRAAGGPSAGRPDNVGGGSGDAVMDSLIDRMAGDIDAQTFGDALGDDLDGGGNAQDDIMEKAYWANQELSM